MTRHTTNVIALTAGLCAVGGLLLWQLNAGEPENTLQMGLLSDHSGSSVNRCAIEEQFAAAAFDAAKSFPGSSFRAFNLGGSATANEPELLDITLPPYTPPRVLSGRTNEDRTRVSFLSSMRALCEAAEAASISPVYLGLKSVVEDVKSQGPTQSTRIVYVHSDLQDNAAPAIRIALHQKLHQPMLNLPSRIDNHGVQILACGYDETRGTIHRHSKVSLTLTQARREDSTDRLKEVWKSLFTNPELVHIDGYCNVNSIVTR